MKTARRYLALYILFIRKKMNHMKITQIDVVDRDSGEIIPIKGYTSNIKYCTIKKINGGMNIMDLFEVMTETCSSKLDIKIFSYLLDNADKENCIEINQSKLAKHFDVSRVKIAELISKIKKTNLLKKVGYQIYQYNPYIFKSKGCTRETLSRLQLEWGSIS